MKAKYLSLILLLLAYAVSLSAQFAGGNGSLDDPYLISKAEHLHRVRYFLDEHFLQINDIDLGIPPYNSGEGWRPIGIQIHSGSEGIPFTGCYDGNGYSISNLRICREGDQVNGLFGKILNATLKGITLTDLEIIGTTGSAGLACSVTSSSISNCNVSGSIISRGLASAAGLVVVMHDSTLSGCTADVFIDEGAGMVCICFSSSIMDCCSSGTVYGMGGLVGNANQSLIRRCSSTAEVIGGYRSGGLVGFNFHLSQIRESYATGNVSGTTAVGGLVGSNELDSAISQCYATGNVTGEISVGGLIGEHTHAWGAAPIPTIALDCFARGRVTGSDMMIGGLIGKAEQAFVRCYSTGEVIGPERYTGGMTGFGGPNYHGSSGWLSYWDKDSSRQHTSHGGESRSTAAMIWPYASDTYQGWDFREIWDMDMDHSLNDGYPVLRGLPIHVSVEDASQTPVASLSLRGFPNPFWENITIELKSPAADKASVMVYNLRGQLVNILFTASKSANDLILNWDGRDEHGKTVASGIYLIRCEVDGRCTTRRIMRVK